MFIQKLYPKATELIIRYYLLCKIIGVSSVVIEQVLQVIPSLFLSICILARVPTLF